MAFSRTCNGQAFLAGEKVFVGTDVAAQMRERALFDSRLTSQVRTGPRAVKSQSERHIPIHEQNVNFLSLRKCNSSWPRVYFFRPAVQRAPPARKRRLLSCKTCSPRASRSGRRSRFLTGFPRFWTASSIVVQPDIRHQFRISQANMQYSVEILKK